MCALTLASSITRVLLVCVLSSVHIIDSTNNQKMNTYECTCIYHVRCPRVLEK